MRASKEKTVAALDVVDAEQASSAVLTVSCRRLAETPNVLISPHVAGQTSESLLKVGTTA
jgi:phosphoglycerate dehydrogenase-like enzyme